MTINISLLLDFFFSIGFPEANKTKKKQTRSTTNPKATKGYTCTQYTQHILIIQVTLIYSFYKPINGLAIFCIIAIESWKSLGPQNLSTFNYSQRRQDPECDLGPAHTYPFVLKNGFFFSTFGFCIVLARPKENAIVIEILVSNDF